MYRYNALPFTGVEGDTVEARIDLGFNINIEQRIKLYGVTSQLCRRITIKQRH